MLSVEYMNGTLKVGKFKYELENMSTYESIDVKLKKLYNQNVDLKKKYTELFNGIMNGDKVDQKEFDKIVSNINLTDENIHKILQKKVLYDNKLKEQYDELLLEEKELVNNNNNTQANHDPKVAKALYNLFDKKRKLMKNTNIIIYPTKFVVDVKKDDAGVEVVNEKKKGKKNKEEAEEKPKKEAKLKLKKVVDDKKEAEEEAEKEAKEKPKKEAKLKLKKVVADDEPHHVDIKEHEDIKKNIKNMISNLFAFKNKEECISQKRSQPYFVKKEDIIAAIQKNKNLEKLMPDKYQNLSKEKLCEYFFD